MVRKLTNKVKNNAGRKTRKSVAGKPVNKANPADVERESLAKELRGLIPRLDSEGLAFLVEQARIHLYNMQADELNRAAEAAEAARAAGAAAERGKPPAGKAGRSRGSSRAAGDNFRIDTTESGSSYYLHYRNDEVMFSRDEMIRLVKIANGEGTDIEIRERLYNWFDRERTDVFACVPMKDKFDERLKALAALIKKTFKLRAN